MIDLNHYSIDETVGQDDVQDVEIRPEDLEQDEPRMIAKIMADSGDWRITEGSRDIAHRFHDGVWRSYNNMHAISVAAMDWLETSGSAVPRTTSLRKQIASPLIGEMYLRRQWMQPPVWGIVPQSDGTVIEVTEDGYMVRPALRTDYITMEGNFVLPDKDDDREPEVFNKVITDIADGRKHFFEYLKWLLATWIFKSNQTQDLFILQGPGGTGKGTLLTIVQNAIGDMCHPVSATTFNNFSLGKLPVINPSAIVFDEVGNIKKLQLVINQLTDGGLKMQLEAKNIQQTSYLYRGHVIILCNGSPGITQEGTSRRQVGVPFRKQFYSVDVDGKKTEDIEIRDKLRAEMPYIIRDLLAYIHKDVTTPAEVIQKTDELNKENNSFKSWWDDCVDIEGNGEYGITEMHKHYQAYCETHDYDRDPVRGTFGLSKDRFREKINERNMALSRVYGRKYFYKAKLLSSFD